MTAEGGLSIGLHWLEGVSELEPSDVLRRVESVVGMQGEKVARSKWYGTAWQVGPVLIRAHGVTGQADRMGVLVRVTGEGCDALGLRALAGLYQGLRLRLSRLDTAVDGGAFTPAGLRRAWLSGRVRTSVKVSRKARADRQWRECDWDSNAEGDTFYMGGKLAERRACVYDRRGPTRFEMRYRGGAAAAVGADLLGGDVGDGWGTRVMGHLRAFVDFVRLDSANASRRGLLPWWAAFVGDAERARVRFGREHVDSFPALAAWTERQVAPSLAVVVERMGWSEVKRMVRAGRARWDTRHYRMAGDFRPERGAFLGASG